MDEAESGLADMSMSSPYEPINSQKGEIRLLRIQPGAYDDDLTMTLEVVVLCDKPIYQALSYVWGDTTPVAACILDGMTVPLNKNLNRALRRFRQETDELILWADALCINQADLDERAAQVRIMRRIFEGAVRIFAWLGDPKNNGNVEAASAMIRPLCGMIGDSPSILKTSLHTFPSQLTPRDTYLRILETSLDSPGGYHADCCYGVREFEMDNIEVIAAWVRISVMSGWPSQFATLCDEDSDAIRIAVLRSERKEKRDYAAGLCVSRILDLLQDMRGSLCADPLDRVYAPLGLADDVPKGSIAIDYDCEVDDLYKQVARYLATSLADPLDVLGAVGHDPLLDPRPSQVSSLPSWVPDWRQRYPGTSLSGLGRRFYTPFPGTITACVRDGSLDIEGCILRAVDIRSITDTWTELESWHTPLNWHETLMSFSDATPELDMAIRRSLVGDIDLNGPAKPKRRGAVMDPALFDRLGSCSDRVSNWKTHEVYSTLSWTCYTRRMAILSNSRVAVLPGAARIGDKIAAFRGGGALYLIRLMPDSKEFHFIGECYVDGWMDGQIVEELGEENVETITLV